MVQIDHPAKYLSWQWRFVTMSRLLDFRYHPEHCLHLVWNTIINIYVFRWTQHCCVRLKTYIFIIAFQFYNTAGFLYKDSFSLLGGKGGGDSCLLVYSFNMFSAISFVNEPADTIKHEHFLFQVFFPDVERVEWLNRVSQWTVFKLLDRRGIRSISEKPLVKKMCVTT